MANNFSNKNISSIDLKGIKYNLKSIPLHGTEDEWLENAEMNAYVPKQGEIVIYDADDKFSTKRVKIGDGVTNINELEFFSPGADWNAAEGEPGHVLNRTHWVEQDSEEILPVTTYTLKSSDTTQLETPLGITAGKTYLVNFNGVAYKCKAFTHYVGGYYEVTALGDYSVAFADMPSTGEPFGIIEYSAEVASAMGVYKYRVNIRPKDVVSGEHYEYTIAITEITENIHKLDGKFLPEGLPYTEGGRVEVLAECQPTYDADEGLFVLLGVPPLEIGKTYIVNWNGVEYTSIAQDGSAMGAGCILGDLGAMDGEATTGEPFIIITMPTDGGTLFAPIDGVTELTVSIYQDGEVVHKLDNKFIDAEWMATTQKRAGDTLFSGTADVYPGGGFMGGTPKNVLIGLVPGETYYVYINEVEYLCVAKSVPGDDEGWMDTVYVGNGSDLGGEATGEPFVIADRQWSDDDVHVLITGGVEGVESGTIPVVIKKLDVVPNKLDPKFLSDGVPYMSDEEEIPLSYEKPTGMDDTGWQITSPVTLEIGETYKVVWGGVEYNCIAQDAGATLGITAAILGNLPALNGTGDSGEPFVGLFADYEVGNGAYGTVIPVNGGRKEFSIYGSGLHKLDPRLVPDGTPSIFEQEKLLRKGTWQVMPQGQLTGKGESIITFTEPLVVGQTYKVRWDLDYYECVARVLAGEYNGMDMEAIVIGNAALFGYPDTGEPFLAGDIYSPQETSLVISVNEAGGEHFFEVHKVTRDIKKLDNRCLDLEWLPVIDKAYLIPEQTVSAVDTAPDGSYMAIVKTNPDWDGGIGLDERIPLTISFQGVDFPAIGTADMDGEYIATENGPFYFVGNNGTWAIIVPSPGTYTVSISDPARTAYNKIPEEFLPDSTATKEYVDEAIATITMTEATSVVIKSSTPGSTKKFKITVDDTGTLTVTEI